MASRFISVCFVVSMVVSAACGQVDDIHFTPTGIKQRADGFITLSCEFGMRGPKVEYVVIEGMNSVSERSKGVGEAESAAVEVFVGGKWRPVPTQRFCGTGAGLSHFVPEIFQTLSFGVGRHSDLRRFLAEFGDPEAGVLFRAVFSVDVVRSAPKRAEDLVVRSAVCFARIGNDGIRTVLPTLYTPKDDVEARDLLDRIREQWPNQTPATVFTKQG